jgi:Zn-dependent M16 (insulinase) family peptidase
MTSHCLERNVDKMVELMTAIYTAPRLTHNPKFLKSLIDQAAMEATNSIMHGGHVFAKLRSAASLSLSDVSIYTYLF